MLSTDVLVVGGGPSGLTVAAEAARSGADVVVVEKRVASPLPRAGTLLPRPLELFDSRGIVGRFIERTARFNPYPFNTSHIWAGMHPVDWTGRESRFGFTLFLSQYETELVLQDWAQESGVTIHHQTTLVGLSQEADHALATVTDVDGAESQIRASYVVGADGGRSATRELSGIGWEGHDSTFTGVVVTAAMEFPWEGAFRVGHNTRGWAASFRFGSGQTRMTLVHADHRGKAQSDPITIEEVEQSASEIFEQKVTIPSLVSATRYGDARRVASQLVRGRVILVGEAARIHYPASGVGMNFCIQDAFNVGWKLGAVLTGAAGESLLASYESERMPIIEDLLASVDAQVGAQFNLTREGLAFLEYFSDQFITQPGVTSALWDDLNGLRTPYQLKAGQDPAVGLPAPDFELLFRDGSSKRIYELLRETPFLVVDVTGAESIAAAEVDGLPARVVAGYAPRMPSALADASALLIRPDTYVGWLAKTPPEPGAVRAALLKALHRTE